MKYKQDMTTANFYTIILILVEEHKTAVPKNKGGGGKNSLIVNTNV